MLRTEALRVHAGGLPQGRCLLRGLTLQVRAGERWVVLGPNGAGKSTLLATLAGLMPVVGGELRLGERMLAHWAAPDLAQQRAWCPQFWVDPFPSTVLETLMLAMTGPPRPRFGLPELLHRLDLEGLAQQDVRVLSGGERQRVALAGALLQGAPLLLLDEPTAHLDLAHQQALRQVLRDWALCGGTVVATVHDLNMAAALATHAIVLDGEGGADVGPADAVLRPPILSRVFGVPVDEVEVCGQRRFWVADAGDDHGLS